MEMTYEKFKTLTDKEKIKELKKLAERYTRDGKPYFPAMATALGGSVIAVANAYNRLVEGKHVGRPKKDLEEKTETVSKITMTEKTQNVKKKTKKEKELAQPNKIKGIDKDEKFETETTISQNSQNDEKQKNKYELFIDGVFDGKEANDRMVAVSSFFYSDASYEIELKIKEL